MANRFPLTLDGSAVKELPSGDNLDLTGSGIVNASSVAATAVTVGGANALTTSSNLSDLANVHTATPTDGQGLQWDNANSRWAPADASAGGRWTQIASTTLNPASPIQAVEFTNFRNSAYVEYEVRWSGYTTAGSVTNEVNLYAQLVYTGVNSGNYMTSDYSIVRWYTKPEGTDANVLVEKSSTEGYFRLSKWNAQWNNSYPASFGKFNFTSDDSMCTWEWNTHAGGRYSSPNDRLALHRSMGLGYNWAASGGTADIEKIKFYAAGSQNYMQYGTFTLYGLTVT